MIGNKKALIAVVLIVFLSLIQIPHARAGSLSPSVVGMFPKDLGEFAYADLKTARSKKWFAQLKDQMLPARFRQFETFLASAGIDPNAQVDELAWGATVPTAEQGDLIVGVAMGQFNPQNTETFFKNQKLATAKVRGYTMFAFGSGEGANDIFFLFLDANTAAFGHRSLLERLVEVRFGGEESLMRNEKLYPLIEEVNGRGMVWAVMGQGYTRIALQQLVPETVQFADAPKLMAKFKAMTLEVQADRGIETRFQTVCETPEDANNFSALLQAGLLYKKMQEAPNNPDLAKVLEDARVAARGDRLEMKMSLTEEMLAALLRRNTFAVKI